MTRPHSRSAEEITKFIKAISFPDALAISPALMTEAFPNWSDDIEAGDDVMSKRHLGSALNTRYGTWHYGPEPHNNDILKRRNQMEAIMTAMEDGEINPEKRRLGSALNARYGTWSFRKTGNKGFKDSSDDEINESKRFLGPALDVKYRHFGSPFYRPAGTWDSMKRPFPKVHRPTWSGRIRRAADEDHVEDAAPDNTVKLHHKDKRTRQKEKRHLGAALGQGYGAFHMTKFRPSKYLRSSGRVDDRKAEARMVKLMG
ncbi:hypothetical protein CAPTEDRAFT_210866 [Capitella teleta]|uniref:Uncharacterized protein n=1 Tax=Capitella teleta TaxID=283909 RepID=R7TY60_CAPTE|nr:hypothetical protein CAPTEDRAFT_210866 [Capitella teleta]|eukprot:ELT98823.1 hypothetical protein CAPTEDRAFT_210866 [Capitella teleta]